MDDAPLAGRRIAVTRAAEQADGLAERLRTLGATVLLCPTIAFAAPRDPAALDAALRRLDEYGWLVLPSAQAAVALLGRLDAHGLPPDALARLRVAAIGLATAAAAQARGVRVALVPAAHTGAGLLAALGDVAGARVLLPQSDIARPELAAGLRARGALVDAVTAYCTVPGPGCVALAAALGAGAVDAVTFASPSALRFLLDGMAESGLARGVARELLGRAALVAIGPTTASALHDEGLPVAAVAAPHTTEGLAQAVAAALGGNAT